MTIIVGVRHKNHYIIAADGQSTQESGLIDNANCRKIEVVGDQYIVGGAGSCTSSTVLKDALIKRRDTDEFLSVYLSGCDISMDKDDQDFYGISLLLELNCDSKVCEILLVHVESNLHVQDLILENQNIVTIGCGSQLFHAAYAALNLLDTPVTLAQVKSRILQAMHVVADQSVFCNHNIEMLTFKISKN